MIHSREEFLKRHGGCDIRQPDNLGKGCLNAVSNALNNTGDKTVLGGFIAAGLYKGGPIGAAATVAVELGGVCGSGIINIAESNCKATTEPATIPPLAASPTPLDPTSLNTAPLNLTVPVMDQINFPTFLLLPRTHYRIICLHPF